MENRYDIGTLVKKHYAKIKTVVQARAFLYYINDRDLLSAVNYKLSLAIDRGLFTGESDDQFWGYVHTIVNNTAVDCKRRNKLAGMVDIEGIAENYCQSTVLQPDFDLKQFSKTISLELLNKISEHDKKVFKSFFIDGLKYDEVANLHGLNLNSVKTSIYRIRAKANAKYGNTYKSLVA